MKQPDRVGAAADTGDGDIRQGTRGIQHLRPRFASDDGLEFADQPGIGMWSDRRAQQVVTMDGIGDPVAQRRVNRGAQRAVARRNRHDFGAEQPHAPDVRRLSRHVDLAHVDDAGQADARAGRGARNAVLAGSGFRDHAARPEALRDQRLAECIVDLVRARVREVLALEPDFGIPGAAKVPRRVSAVGRPAKSRSSRASSARNAASRSSRVAPSVSRSSAGTSVSGT